MSVLSVFVVGGPLYVRKSTSKHERTVALQTWHWMFGCFPDVPRTSVVEWDVTTDRPPKKCIIERTSASSWLKHSACFPRCWKEKKHLKEFLNRRTGDSKKTGNMGALRQSCTPVSCEHCACFVFFSQMPLFLPLVHSWLLEGSHICNVPYSELLYSGLTSWHCAFFPRANDVSRGQLRKGSWPGHCNIPRFQLLFPPGVAVFTHTHTVVWMSHLCTRWLVVVVTLSALPDSLPACRIYGDYRGFTSGEVLMWNASMNKRTEKGTRQAFVLSSKRNVFHNTVPIQTGNWSVPSEKCRGNLLVLS